MDQTADRAGTGCPVEEYLALRRHKWWRHEAQRPADAVMGRGWTLNPADEEAEVPVSALVVEMSDQEAWYWGFRAPDSLPTSMRWRVTVPYTLPAGHRGRTAVRVLLTVGDRAELVTPLHPPGAPLDVPVERIVREADVPVAELPGRWLSVDLLGGADARGFRALP
ncbi:MULTISPECIES: hypothetical protein [unclassified Nocardiopsis]|uniref:hypothetical protein n=1 Tax=unclassified Nocardiopsis TaxID=2649073 RepID=UPI00135C50FA|nr:MULTISPECIES: hypothetical protein [unclassified Nocardiopsis]